MTGRTRHFPAFALAVVVSTGLIGPALVSADDIWLPASDLSAAGGPATAAKSAIDGTGGAIVVWRRFDGSGSAQIQVATRTPQTGAWSSPRTLASDDVNVPDVAADAAGNATVVWKRFDGNNYVIQAASKSSLGLWSTTAITVSQSGQNANDPDVAMDANGSATVVWKRFDGNNFVIQASSRPPSGIWETPTTISVAGADASNPHIAADSAGNLVATWKRFNGANNVVEVARRNVGSAWSAPQVLSATGQSANGPQVAVGPSGTAAITWFRSDGTSSVVEAAKGSTTSGFGAPQALSATGQDAVNARVAIDGAGNAVVVWRRYNGTRDVVQASTSPPGGPWGAAETISQPAQDANSPDVAMDAAGKTLITWVRREGADDIAVASLRLPGGVWSVAQPLSGAGQSAVGPTATLSSNGTAVVVWTRSDGSNTVVQAGVRPSEGPAFTGLVVPSSAPAKSPISMSVQSVAGPFPLAGLPRWTFGDGRVALGLNVTHAYSAAGDFTVTVSQADTAGNQVSVPRRIKIVGGAVVVPLRISGARATPKVFQGVRACATRARKSRVPCATTVAFTANRSVAVRLVLTRTDSGKSAGTITVRARRGLNRVKLPGAIGRRPLLPGRYLVSIVPAPPTKLGRLAGTQAAILIT